MYVSGLKLLFCTQGHTLSQKNICYSGKCNTDPVKMIIYFYSLGKAHSHSVEGEDIRKVSFCD